MMQANISLQHFSQITFHKWNQKHTNSLSRALSSGSGFIKLNGYHSENNVAKDGAELNSSHMNSSACCSANRDLKELF